MFMMNIILALWWIWLPALLIWLYLRNKDKKPKSNGLNNENNQRWLQYIGSFSDVVKTKAEKHLIKTLLEGKSADQLYLDNQSSPDQAETNKVVTQPLATSSEPTLKYSEPVHVAKPKTPIDNTLILLYFGAFLLVASAGLFVAISGVTPILRTILVAVTAGLLYIGGLWIYKTKPKLMQAGLSFVGTGMVIAPLTGVAWYNLVAGQTGGAVIWLVTSLLCLGLYTHAFIYVKNNFMPYLLIGSFVSSIESLVLVGSMPNYVFAWVAVLLGIGFQVYRSFSKENQYLDEAQDNSAQILVPLSILGSLILIPNYGSAQLAVTLILSGIYYGALAFRLRPTMKEIYSPASQLALISGFSNVVYSQTDSFRSVMMFLAIVGLAYVVSVLIVSKQKLTENSLPHMGALVVFIATALSIAQPVDFTLYMAEAFILGAVVWIRFVNKEVLMVTGLILIALPFSVGQYALTHKLNSEVQSIICALPLLVFSALTILSYKRKSLNDQMMSASSLVLLSAVVLIGTTMTSGFVAVTVASIFLLMIFSALQYTTNDSKWWSVASVAITAPFFYAMIVKGFSSREFTIATAIMVGVNTTISLITREEIVRWILTAGILIGPVALGAGGSGFKWEETGYSVCYLVAMGSLVFARAVARGKLLVARNVPLSSYDKQSSLSFSAGYLLSAVIATGISLSSPDSQVLTSVVLTIVTIMLGGALYYIENEIKALAIIPILVQFIILSAIRPDLDKGLYVALTAILLSFVGAVIYLFIDTIKSLKSDDRTILLTSALVASFFGPGMILVNPKVQILFPVSLTIAGLLSFYHCRRESQGAKELSLLIIAFSVHWTLYLAGVKNIHIHTHIAMLLLGSFAWWRAMKNDNKNSLNYIYLAYVVATAPMILQALGGNSGGMYGIILIIQQVAFMTIGALINQKFLIKAGLWVALASVLYQLRGLGWAFLSIVAIILIGFAVYRLQKHDEVK